MKIRQFILIITCLSFLKLNAQTDHKLELFFEDYDINYSLNAKISPDGSKALLREYNKNNFYFIDTNKKKVIKSVYYDLNYFYQYYNSSDKNGHFIDLDVDWSKLEIKGINDTYKYKLKKVLNLDSVNLYINRVSKYINYSHYLINLNDEDSYYNFYFDDYTDDEFENYGDKRLFLRPYLIDTLNYVKLHKNIQYSDTLNHTPLYDLFQLTNRNQKKFFLVMRDHFYHEYVSSNPSYYKKVGPQNLKENAIYQFDENGKIKEGLFIDTSDDKNKLDDHTTTHYIISSLIGTYNSQYASYEDNNNFYSIDITNLKELKLNKIFNLPAYKYNRDFIWFESQRMKDQYDSLALNSPIGKSVEDLKNISNIKTTFYKYCCFEFVEKNNFHFSLIDTINQQNTIYAYNRRGTISNDIDKRFIIKDYPKLDLIRIYKFDEDFNSKGINIVTEGYYFQDLDEDFEMVQFNKYKKHILDNNTFEFASFNSVFDVNFRGINAVNKATDSIDIESIQAKNQYLKNYYVDHLYNDYHHIVNARQEMNFEIILWPYQKQDDTPIFYIIYNSFDSKVSFKNNELSISTDDQLSKLGVKVTNKTNSYYLPYYFGYVFAYKIDSELIYSNPLDFASSSKRYGPNFVSSNSFFGFLVEVLNSIRAGKDISKLKYQDVLKELKTGNDSMKDGALNFNSLSDQNYPIVGFSSDGQYALWSTKSNKLGLEMLLFDVITGDILIEPIVTSIDFMNSTPRLSFYDDFSVCVFPINFHHYRIFDLKNKKILGDYYRYNENEWYVVTPEGFYDKSDLASNNLYYVYNNEEVFDLDQFQKYYQYDGLLDLLLGKTEGTLPKGVPPLQDQIKNLPPKIDYTLDGSKLEGTIEKRQGGISNVYLNIAGNDVGEPLKLKFDRNGIAKLKDIDILAYSDKLNPLEPNTIYIRATNSNGTIKTNGPKIKYKYQPKEYNPYSRLYALFVGINDYKKKELKLDFAVSDVQKIKDHINSINSQWQKTEKPVIKILTDSLATKANILGALKDFKDEAKAQDIIMLVFSGHGITGSSLTKNQNNNYYYITHEFSESNLKSFSELMVDNKNFNSNQAISSSELIEFLNHDDLYPTKKILIMDSCFSGQFIEQLRNQKSETNDLTREQSKALQNLNDKTGTVVITASRNNEKAYESKRLQHSLLTWGLLSALKESYNGELLDVGSWFQRATNIVKTKIPEDFSQTPSLDLNNDIDFQLGIIDSETQKNIKLPVELPTMSSSKIVADVKSVEGTDDVADQLQEQLNTLLNRHNETHYNDWKFVFTSSNSFGGYKLRGSLFNQGNDEYILKYRLLKDGSRISLGLPKCTDNDEQLLYCFEIDNIEEDVPELVKQIILSLDTRKQQ